MKGIKSKPRVNLKSQILAILGLSNESLSVSRLVLILLLIFKDRWTNLNSLRASVSRVLKELRREGIVRKVGKKYELKH